MAQGYAKPLYVEIDGREDKGANQPRMLYAGDQLTGQPYVLVTNEGITLFGDKDDVFNVSPEYGVFMSGRLSLSATPDQVSFGGGFYRINPMVLTCLPSTTPTPIPWLVKSQPDLLEGSDDVAGNLSDFEADSDMAGL